MRVRTGFATPAGDAFADDDWQHAKGGDFDRPTTSHRGDLTTRAGNLLMTWAATSKSPSF